MCENCAAAIQAVIAANHSQDSSVKIEAERDLELARIHRDEAIQLAKINASSLKDEAVVEAVAEMSHAEGLAEGLEIANEPEVIEAPEPEIVPVVIDEPETETEPEPEVTELPEHSTDELGKPAKKGNPWVSQY